MLVTTIHMDEEKLNDKERDAAGNLPAVSFVKRRRKMSEGYEYNLLTQELLLQGYTAEHYPDYVRIGNGRLGKSPLENFMRRFYIYQRLSGK